MHIAMSASTMNRSDMKGTSIEATLPMRLMPPMIIIAVKAAMAMPTIIFATVESDTPKVEVSVPDILLVCAPLMPSAASIQNTAATYPSHFQPSPFDM